MLEQDVRSATSLLVTRPRPEVLLKRPAVTVSRSASSDSSFSLQIIHHLSIFSISFQSRPHFHRSRAALALAYGCPDIRRISSTLAALESSDLVMCHRVIRVYWTCGHYRRMETLVIRCSVHACDGTCDPIFVRMAGDCPVSDCSSRDPCYQMISDIESFAINTLECERLLDEDWSPVLCRWDLLRRIEGSPLSPHDIKYLQSHLEKGSLCEKERDEEDVLLYKEHFLQWSKIMHGKEGKDRRVGQTHLYKNAAELKASEKKRWNLWRGAKPDRPIESLEHAKPEDLGNFPDWYQLEYSIPQPSLEELRNSAERKRVLARLGEQYPKTYDEGVRRGYPADVLINAMRYMHGFKKSMDVDESKDKSSIEGYSEHDQGLMKALKKEYEEHKCSTRRPRHKTMSVSARTRGRSVNSQRSTRSGRTGSSPNSRSSPSPIRPSTCSGSRESSMTRHSTPGKGPSESALHDHRPGDASRAGGAAAARRDQISEDDRATARSEGEAVILRHNQGAKPPHTHHGQTSCSAGPRDASQRSVHESQAQTSKSASGSRPRRPNQASLTPKYDGHDVEEAAGQLDVDEITSRIAHHWPELFVEIHKHKDRRGQINYFLKAMRGIEDKWIKFTTKKSANESYNYNQWKQHIVDIGWDQEKAATLWANEALYFYWVDW